MRYEEIVLGVRSCNLGLDLGQTIWLTNCIAIVMHFRVFIYFM